MHNFFKILSQLFPHKYQTGELAVLANGNPEQISIILDFTPKEVWLELKEPDDVPVCTGGADCFDKHIIHHGFVLSINLSSNMRLIRWFARR